MHGHGNSCFTVVEFKMMQNSFVFHHVFSTFILKISLKMILFSYIVECGLE